MKNIFLFTLLVTSFGFYAQGQRGNGGGRPPQNQNGQKGEQREVKEFKASDVAGVFYYDIEEVIKKIKVKDEATQYKVKTVLKDYNFKIKEIAFLNSQKFKELDIVMESMQGSQNRRPENNDNNDGETEKESPLREKVDKVIRPVREEINQNEELLNETLTAILSEKQLKKWVKYQKKIKEELAPKKLDRNQNSGQSQNGNRQQRRF
tara:strand:+ start:119 stop:739 length:621 start_codon:yes stop_codon:yes gene_type:complete